MRALLKALLMPAMIITMTISHGKLALAASSLANPINETGTALAPVSVGACSGAATKVIAGASWSSQYWIMPEGADIRCVPGTSGDVASGTAPSATVGFLFKSNILVNIANGVKQGQPSATLRLDCCGVAGAVPTDTWHE